MSGGSFDYMFSEMQCGESVKFAGGGGAQMIAHIRDRLDRLRAGEVEEYIEGAKAAYERVPYRYPAEVEIAVPAVIARVERALALIDEVQALMRELAPVAHSCEWDASCDSGPDDTLNACRKWMHGRLGGGA